MISTGSRALRRQLRPLAWAVLEEVALDAIFDDGRLVARTSARQVADRLGVDPSTAVKALSTLRRRGLLSLEREHGPAGRFGLSVYVLGSVDGLAVVPPRALTRCLVPPSLEEPRSDGSWPATESASPEPDRPGAVKPRMDQPRADVSRPAKAETLRPGRSQIASGSSVAPPPHCPGQTALDFGSASS